MVLYYRHIIWQKKIVENLFMDGPYNMKWNHIKIILFYWFPINSQNISKKSQVELFLRMLF